MKLKCIGGPSDGKRVEVPEGYRDINVRDPFVQPRMMHGEISNIGPTINTTVYTRRIMREYVDGKMQELQYLAPAGVAEIDAVRHLFE
jgi:hypothetical protein